MLVTALSTRTETEREREGEVSGRSFQPGSFLSFLLPPPPSQSRCLLHRSVEHTRTHNHTSHPHTMAQALAGKGAKRLIERHVKQFEPEDPHYEEYTDSNGKKKRRKVSRAHASIPVLPASRGRVHTPTLPCSAFCSLAFYALQNSPNAPPTHARSRPTSPSPSQRPLPPGLTKKDAKILRKVRRRAHYLDKGFYICGLRFGWTFFIGIIPGVGDLTDAVLNYKLVVVPSKDAE